MWLLSFLPLNPQSLSCLSSVILPFYPQSIDNILTKPGPQKFPFIVMGPLTGTSVSEVVCYDQNLLQPYLYTLDWGSLVLQ